MWLNTNHILPASIGVLVKASCPFLCSNCFHCFFNFVSWIDLVQQPLKKDFRGSTLPLETFFPEFPLRCLQRRCPYLTDSLSTFGLTKVNACVLSTHCTSRKQLILQKMYKVVKVKHITTLPPWKFLQAIPYSEAILDTAKWTFVARNSHEYFLSVITWIQHTLTALKVVVLLHICQLNVLYNNIICL